MYEALDTPSSSAADAVRVWSSVAVPLMVAVAASLTLSVSEAAVRVIVLLSVWSSV